MESYNPWWLGEPDPVYEEWRRAKPRWVPRVVDAFSLEPFSLNFLVGPRQVGKTTALKILVYRLLEHRDPRSIFYYSCDELSDYRELGEVVDAYLSARRAWGVKSSVIILDEVTFVEEWYRALKSRIDRRQLTGDVLIVTGSASLELLAGKERFPGRRGRGRDVYMYPLSFTEYLEHIAGVKPSRAALEDYGFAAKMGANAALGDKIGSVFTSYLETGGFPLPIRELYEHGRVTYASRRAYLDWVRSDWARAGRSEHLMKEVIAYLLEAAPSPISWNSIAKNTSIRTAYTAREYVETLEALMAAKTIYWASPSGEPDYRKNKKIVFTDPFLYHVFSHYTGVHVDQPAIVEATVTAHLARRYPTYYWRNSTEVDAIALAGGKPVGVEVKWRRRPSRARKPLPTLTLDRRTTPLFLATLDASPASLGERHYRHRARID